MKAQIEIFDDRLGTEETRTELEVYVRASLHDEYERNIDFTAQFKRGTASDGRNPTVEVWTDDPEFNAGFVFDVIVIFFRIHCRNLAVLPPSFSFIRN